MKRLMLTILFSTTVIFGSETARAISPMSDVLYIYEAESRISDSNAIIDTNDSSPKICRNGEFWFKQTDENMELIVHRCDTPVMTKEEWSIVGSLYETYDDYLNRCIKKASYNKKIIIPVTDVGSQKHLSSANTAARHFKCDLKTGSIMVLASADIPKPSKARGSASTENSQTNPSSMPVDAKGENSTQNGDAEISDDINYLFIVIIAIIFMGIVVVIRKKK